MAIDSIRPGRKFCCLKIERSVGEGGGDCVHFVISYGWWGLLPLPPLYCSLRDAYMYVLSNLRIEL